jgi:SAM-dependent methyltransferase
LTENSFWENYWKKIKLPSEVDLRFSFDRCLSQALADYFPQTGTVFEVGCAPGKWLAFAAKKFGLHPSGIEYSQGGIAATKRNFHMLNISYGSLIAADFFKTSPDKLYDVVMSFGFIEHFDDVDHVVKMHLSWLKPGGILILGIPNFSGLNGVVQSILDKDILDKHNLNIMNLAYFEQLTNKFNIEPLFIDYICSFEPALAIPKYRFGSPIQFFTRGVLFGMRVLRKFRFLDYVNSKYFSSYILAVYRKF